MSGPAAASIAAAVFWTSAAALLYAYVGYPLTLALLPKRRSRPAAAPMTPAHATVVIPAHNEVAHIGRTVENKLQQDYPRDRLDIVVVSDGSSDGTDDVVREFAARGVRLIRQEPRQGKTEALNRARAASTGEVLVFSDANSVFDGSAVRHLVQALAPPDVGYVTGHLILGDPSDDQAAATGGLFLRYEHWLRRLESSRGSVIGVNGGIDAVRRELFEPMRKDQLPDLVLPFAVLEKGYRVVYCPEAVAREHALARGRDEFAMRVRVSLRAFHCLWEMRRLLHPRFGRTAFQIWVHKVLRYGVCWFFGAALLATPFLPRTPIYRTAMAAEAAILVLAAVGAVAPRARTLRIVGAPYYFVLVNSAAAVAFLRFVRGTTMVTWTPRKGA